MSSLYNSMITNNEHSTKRQLSTSHDKDESDLNQSGPDFGNVSKIPKFAQITPSNQTVYAIGSNRHGRRRDEDNFDAITGANHEESCLEDLRLILTEDIEKCNSAQLISYRQKLSMSLQTAFNQSIHKNDLDNGIIAEASAKISQLDNSILMLRDLRRVASNKQLFENYSQGHKKLGSNSHGRRLDDIVYPPVPDHSLTNESTSGESHDLNTTAFGIKKQMDRIKIGANKIIVQKAKEDDKELADLKGEQ
uniref:Biogenesis of lysosome-related organelles complex 1 subunit KXD1 n=1 Tax=Panagrolaimus sp. PS1159 TaxID=55785 RepID=A0AC35FTH7_9BILA